MSSFSVRLGFKLLLITLVNLSTLANIKCAKIQTDTTTQTPKLLSLLKNEEVACTVHQNCSSRILTLDTYCCPSSNTCCNWFEFTSKYKSASSLPLKAPSILTILAILLFIISFLFVCYCFSILFCFCFKCGIFKRPKVIIMSQSHDTESGLFDNRSPKHSTSSTSSASSSSMTPNRRSHRQIPRGNKQYKKKTNKQRSRSARSPTARAYSNKRHNQHSEPEIYADFDIQADSDSPFLIPPELNEQVQQRMNRSYNIQNFEHRTDSSRLVTPSAPLANDNNHFEAENQRSNNILEPVIGSSLSGSTSSSLGFGQSLMEAAVSSTVVESTNSGHTSATTVTQATMQSYHYHDDKPPSYEDIIKTNY